MLWREKLILYSVNLEFDLSYVGASLFVKCGTTFENPNELRPSLGELYTRPTTSFRPMKNQK